MLPQDYRYKMDLFFLPDLTQKDSRVVFSKEESKHIARVMRKSVGDHLQVTNGKGLEMTVELEQIGQSKVIGKTTQTVLHSPLPYQLHIAIAPTKNINRFEWFLEKATEIGIHQITPLICDHSERKVIKAERLDKIIVAALKQSKQFYKPVLNPLISFKDFVAAQPKAYIAHCQPEEKKGFFGAIAPKDNITVLIGPEGDFSLKEVSIALENNYTAISLGEQRLRTETAGIIATHTVALRAQ
ncbi:MAG: 16S rRNA (uracil(1498)-N(3))-methyltransferase [Flavobacteriaceae bacterium]